MTPVGEYLRKLDGDALAMVEALRRIVAASHPRLVENIKWNAPNFALGDEDRITLGIERKGGVRMVLHRGGTPRYDRDFAFEDRTGLAKWPAPDRAVLTFHDVAAIEAKRDVLIDLCRRWIEATASPRNPQSAS